MPLPDAYLHGIGRDVSLRPELEGTDHLSLPLDNTYSLLRHVAPESLEPVRAAEAKLQRLLVARRAHLLDSIEQGMRARQVASAYRPAEEVRGWDQLG